MMESEQRRKRRRSFKATSQAHHHFFSVRSFILCFCFAIFLFVLCHLRIGSAVSRPVLIVSSLTRLSSSASNSIRHSDDDASGGSGVWDLKIEDLVLFPDHVLVIVASGMKLRRELLNCVYHKKMDASGDEIIRLGRLGGSDEVVGIRKGDGVLYESPISVDVYGELKSIVRCPLPRPNYSAAVDLQGGGRKTNSMMSTSLLFQINQTVPSWEKVAYAAELDGNTAVVFVKGLNLRPGKEHDPAQFVCHFGSGNWERDGGFTLTTRAVTAAQEVIRCSLPISIQKNPEKAEGIRVSIGVASYVRRRKAPVYNTLPSVAKISGARRSERKNQEKYNLCMCTMVWNQASALNEWITYHAWLGVERWFIYDNNSDDNIEEVIEDLGQGNYNVSRHTWPWIKTQEAGFSHCTLRAKNECQWVGFMDVDEFFYFPFPTPQHPASNIFPGQNALQALVSNFSSNREIAEIRTACHSFGPSGLSSPPPEGVMAGYTCRLQSPERHKSIVHLDALDDTLLTMVHHFRLRGGFKYVNLPQSTAVLNHYKYQVWETFRAKFFRRVATYVADWRENQNEGSRDRAPGLGTEAIEPPNWRLKFCEVWDTGLRDIVLANLADPSTGLLPWQMPF